MTRFSILLRHAIMALAVALTSGWVTRSANASAADAPAAALIPVRSTSVQYVLANENVNIRSGPGLGYRVIERFFAGQTAAVTGLSLDRGWWRVPCPPHGAVGNCFVSADPRLTTRVPPNDPNEPITYQNISARRMRTTATINVRRGPDTGFPAFAKFAAGRVIVVNGISLDGNWWHVQCPAGAINDNCFVSRQYTRPV